MAKRYLDHTSHITAHLFTMNRALPGDGRPKVEEVSLSAMVLQVSSSYFVAQTLRDDSCRLLLFSRPLRAPQAMHWLPGGQLERAVRMRLRHGAEGAQRAGILEE